MIGRRHIPWFNPRQLDDATVLALNTGREALLAGFFDAVRERLAHPGNFRHWLLTGVRGAGKSFFLRVVQSSFASVLGAQARFVLLPEEHRNIYSAHEFLLETQRMLRVDQGDEGVPPVWRVADPAAAWNQALTDLLQAYPEPLLVVGVENFDTLLEQAFADPTDNARLRSLMNNEPRLMLLATAIQGDFDEQYNQRLFRQFEHHPVPHWDETDHRHYLTRRAAREGKKPSIGQLARIDAYSRYTGGNARAAAVLAAAILDEHEPLVSAIDLDAAIEAMSDYYRALIDRIPINTRKLFDALVRGGDPASQTAIAERTGAQQNEISRAFAWLVDYGYVCESREPGQKTKQYRVLDRLFVQFYRMRSIAPGQRSKLSLMAELLADTVAFEDKWRYANRYAADGEENEARTLAELALKERRIDPALLPENARSLKAMLALGKHWEHYDAIANIRNASGGDASSVFQEIVRRHPSDAELKRAIEETSVLARAASRGAVSGKQLVSLLEGSPSLCPVQKYHVLIAMLNSANSELQWQELIRVFENEPGKFQELKLTQGDAVARLQEDAAVGIDYPLTRSLQDMSRQPFGNGRLLANLGMPIAADWAARAAIQWQAVGQAARASESLDTCCMAMEKIHADDPFSEIPLDIATRLEPILASFPPAAQAQVWEWKGLALRNLNRFPEAYQAFSQARVNHQRADQPRGATWNMERMAWCAGGRGDVDLALIHHRQAIEEHLTRQNKDAAAWNLGQISRYTAGKEGAGAAWQFLDTELNQAAGHEVNAIQQLGDAVFDSLGQHGEPAAFALASELLQGLAARPQYPTEACLRALWIDMIDMGVAHRLLRDLLGEWQRLFGAQYPPLAALEQLLRDWLDDLDTPKDEREKRRKTLDPDLATTLTALGQALNPEARRRLGLPSAPKVKASLQKAGG